MRLLECVWLCFSNKNRSKYLSGLGLCLKFSNHKQPMKKGSCHLSSLRCIWQGLTVARRRNNDDWVFQRKLTVLLCESWDAHLVFERLPRYEERHSAKSYCALNNFNATNRDQKMTNYIAKNYSFSLCSQNVASWMSRRNVIPKYLIRLGFQLEKVKKIRTKRIVSVTILWIFDARIFFQRTICVS